MFLLLLLLLFITAIGGLLADVTLFGEKFLQMWILAYFRNKYFLLLPGIMDKVDLCASEIETY